MCSGYCSGDKLFPKHRPKMIQPLLLHMNFTALTVQRFLLRLVFSLKFLFVLLCDSDGEIKWAATKDKCVCVCEQVRHSWSDVM